MITVPTLLVDEGRCRENIRFMSEKAKLHGLNFRPHFKTHQSHEIGNWFRDYGVTSITCSSLSMAEHFVQDGWNDITVAFPVNVLEKDRINDLASKIQLNLLVESVESVERLMEFLNHPVRLLIKLDLGTHRTGIDSKNLHQIHEIIRSIESSDKMTFWGFLGHAGHSYGARGEDEILQVHSDAMTQIRALRQSFPHAYISYGDTPTGSRAEDFEGIDELRPGNFAFYDLMQEQIGSCSMNQIAVALACPVVAKHPERNEVVIYGGGVHFSKDSIEVNGKKRFGVIVSDRGDGWGEPTPDVFLEKISQEHGIIKAADSWIEDLRIGDVVKVLPVHSCLTMDLLRKFQVV